MPLTITAVGRQFLIYHKLDQLEARRIGPVQIFSHDHYRLPACTGQYPFNQRFQLGVALKLGRQCGPPITLGKGRFSSGAIKGRASLA